MILLVRHARAGDRSNWKGDDRLRPLDKRGLAQAEALAPLLVQFEPTWVASSPALRCVQTVEPTARELGTKVEVVDALAEGNSKEAIRLVRSCVRERAVVLCSHGDVVPDVLDALSKEGMRGWAGDERSQKGSVWVVETNGAKFKTARYYPPPA